MNYGFVKEINTPLNEIENVLSESLAKEGFGILTKIDASAKFKEKLGIDFPHYMIYGACSPKHAYKAIANEINVGLLLPCNVIVYTKGEKNYLSIIKPAKAMDMIHNPELNDVAVDVEAKLEKIFNSIN